MSILIDSFTFVGPNGDLATDIHRVPSGMSSKGTIIFAHGYKGFKDWGAWHLMGDNFAKAGWEFVRFNFSHNGHLSSDQMNCSDESAWSRNNYSIEKSDLVFMLSRSRSPFADNEKLIVMGHSRGGGIAALAASEVLVDKIVLLASVSDFGARFPKGAELIKWQQSNMLKVLNTRTGLTLTHQYAFYEDFVNNSAALDIETAVRSLSGQLLVIHGEDDKAVSPSEGKNIANWAELGEYYGISNTGHTFDISHPWTLRDLPSGALILVEKTLEFLDR
jgi:pimeloyl-ACP methyl ester carboxylesterase